MSAFLSLANRRARLSTTSGFTLLEMLTVIFIVGLSAALVLPNLPGLFERASFALERESLVRALNNLPSNAFSSNQDMVLFGEIEGSRSTDPSMISDQYIDIDDLGLSIPYRTTRLRLAKLNVPMEWKVSVPDPIFYRSSGFCTGGRVLIEIGRQRFEIKADAPYCQFSGESE